MFLKVDNLYAERMCSFPGDRANHIGESSSKRSLCLQETTGGVGRARKRFRWTAAKRCTTGCYARRSTASSTSGLPATRWRRWRPPVTWPCNRCAAGSPITGAVSWTSRRSASATTPPTSCTASTASRTTCRRTSPARRTTTPVRRRTRTVRGASTAVQARRWARPAPPSRRELVISRRRCCVSRPVWPKSPKLRARRVTGRRWSWSRQRTAKNWLSRPSPKRQLQRIVIKSVQ